MNTVVITACEVLTAYGMGREKLWNGLLEGHTAITPCSLYGADRFRGGKAAQVPLPSSRSKKSRVARMLAALLAAKPPPAPTGAALLLATTLGEIDLMERMVLQGKEGKEGTLPSLLPAAQRLTGVQGPAAVISAACASSTAALARALIMIRSGTADAVLVLAVDALSEFLFSGFSSLMALDEDIARPFDRDRAGLSLGEAAACMLVMSRERAAQEGYPVLGILRGASMTNDANHMTGPARDGAGLARAAQRALADAHLESGQIGFVAAHGTGTRYNDAMEIKAITSVLPAPRPMFSIKGGVGHTMGSAGLLQAAAALRAAEQGFIPGTVGTRHVDSDAARWVSSAPQAVPGQTGLVVNAGFGGINAAVILDGPDATD